MNISPSTGKTSTQAYIAPAQGTAGVMPPKRRRRDEPPQQPQGAARERREALCGSLYESVKESLDEGFRELEQENQRAEQERARLLAEARKAAAKVMKDAEKQAKEMRRDLDVGRAALERERAAMEEAHTFQTNKVLLNVGGHRFETSRQTLVSVPDTYLASLFSGRFELASDAEGAYFIDRDGAHFRHVLNFLRDSGSFKLSSGVAEATRDELAVELEFYGLLDRMLPYHAQEQVGHLLLQRACVAGTKRELRTAVAQARALAFTFGSTTPFLKEAMQDLRFVITDRVVHGSPVWAAEGGRWFMYRDADNAFSIGSASDCVEGSDRCCIFNATLDEAAILAPTELHTDEWLSLPISTLELQYASAKRMGRHGWVCVPNMRITAVHGLDDGDPAMAAALRQLAALP